MAKYISGDFDKPMDGNGNFFGTVPVTGLRPPDGNNNPPILGVAQRIGVSGTEATLPRVTFWVPQNSGGNFGWLMVRGDFQRNLPAWFRVAAFQNS
jgi:hypothetical protein